MQVIHFIDRSLTATRRDQPDQVTGDPYNASAPPPVCTAATLALPLDAAPTATAEKQSTHPSGVEHDIADKRRLLVHQPE